VPANGASRSLPGAPAKFSSLYFADLHHQNLRPGEPPEGQPDGGEGNEEGTFYSGQEKGTGAMSGKAGSQSFSHRRVALCRFRSSFLLGRFAGALAVVFEDPLARHRLHQQIGQGPYQGVDAVG
jgi:hypothetical protein